MKNVPKNILDREQHYLPFSDVNCTDPGYTQNGARWGNAPFTCNSNVTYLCNVGYWMSGTSVITCGSDGLWDAEVPKCLRKRKKF